MGETRTSSKQRKRRDAILAAVGERGTISVGALADLLDVSMQTIRRDIDALCENEGLRRKHGRIELNRKRLNTPFDQRADTNVLGKHAIGEAAALLIPNGATLFLSIGSTPLSVARALLRRKELTVITNNLSAAMALSEEISNRIILPGGELRLPDRDILGSEVVDVMDRYRAEFAVFGVAGVAEDGGLLDFHTAEVQVRQKMRENARTSILVLDSSKFGRRAPALGGDIADADHLVLDRLPEANFAPLVERVGERLVLAEEALA